MFLRMGKRGYGVYLFFATMQVLSIPYIVFLLPETRNIPLEEMDRLFAQKNVWTANKVVMAELRQESEAKNLRESTETPVDAQDTKEAIV
jgi:hypothetical protein